MSGFRMNALCLNNNGQALMCAVTAAALFALLPVHVAATDLAPRRTLPGDSVMIIPPADLDTPRAEAPDYRLVVKFQDRVKARASEDGSIGFTGIGDAKPTWAIAAQHRATFESLIRTPPEVLEGLYNRAISRTGREQPDLEGILLVDVGWQTLRDLYDLGEQLRVLDETEAVQIEKRLTSLPGDIAPPTPYLGSYQSYRGPNPGLDFDYAWSQGFRGAGVRLSDVEYDWRITHEDVLNTEITLEDGQTPDPHLDTDADHGIAAIGLAAADVDEYGIDGVVDGAQFFLFPVNSIEDGDRLETAILNACGASSPGDVVLVEQQTGDERPVEISVYVFLEILVCTNAGVVVVEAAGNGSIDLDVDQVFQYRDDSGAILVGAGSSDVYHEQLNLSNYGCRVAVQSWGENVFTLGYSADAICYGTEDRDQCYTPSFNGTSSASALVAAAAVALQSDIRRTPEDLRRLMMQTGFEQGSGNPIGRFVSLRRALDGTLTNSVVWTDFGFGNQGIDRFEAGTECAPFNTVAEAIDLVQDGGTIKITSRHSTTLSTEGPLLITKPMTIEAVDQPVVIAPTP